MNLIRRNGWRSLAICVAAACSLPCSGQQGLRAAVNSDGQYSIGLPDSDASVLTSGVAAEVNGHWFRSADYPKPSIKQSTVQGYLGDASQWDVRWSGLSGAPTLLCRFRSYKDQLFADVQVSVENAGGSAIQVQAIRVVDAAAGEIVNLGGPAAADRVLSDSFSEDRPAMKIHDLADAQGQMHRAVGSQLIYNRQSHESLFVGALTSERFLTILRLRVDGASHIASYEVDSTGTTELEKENSLQESTAEDQIELNVPVAAGGQVASETILLSVARNYHPQLETYGSLIRKIHNARTAAPPLMGWWSWTAFYFGLNEGAALTNAQWESQQLKQYGYNVFHIDEGYQYARGEYTTANAPLFPSGMGSLEYKVRGLGLLPGIWTAPFEVSDRSWVYEHHPDWLVKNASGKPIHAGFVVGKKDPLFVLDVTNPGAAEYLRKTYWTLTHEWGIHYIKMDFMDDSAIEGYYYKPNTTALEAQRIGLQIIRGAVGEDVYLDKDGSVMMNPVGYVDYGRISQDTGHKFRASRDAATGMAARYYMNRNFFVSDPDAFTVSTQTLEDQSWHEGKTPATLDEARVSMALAAVSGGMLEIGDNLPSLESTPERIALIKNEDLIDMVRLGKASVPMDLMEYSEQDGQPSVFLLKESPRQCILSVFNWTEKSTEHKVSLASLGLDANGRFSVSDVFDGKEGAQPSAGALKISTRPHSVAVLKIIDQGIPVAAPVVTVNHPSGGSAGDTLAFTAKSTSGDAVVAYTWDFGDGVELIGDKVSHAWTEPGDYDVRVQAKGLGGKDTNETFRVHITGYMSTVFNPGGNRRYSPPQ